MFHFPTRLYHGTVNIHLSSLIGGVDITKCRKDTDFGQGFYLTKSVDQAREWARDKADFEYRRERKKNPNPSIFGIVIEYSVNIQTIINLKGQVFQADDSWCRFVYNNRIFSSFHHPFDYVEGPMADGSIALLMESCKQGKATFEDFCEGIQPIFGHQVSFHNSQNVNQCIRYRGVIERV